MYGFGTKQADLLEALISNIQNKRLFFFSGVGEIGLFSQPQWGIRITCGALYFYILKVQESEVPDLVVFTYVYTWVDKMWNSLTPPKAPSFPPQLVYNASPQGNLSLISIT